MHILRSANSKNGLHVKFKIAQCVALIAMSTLLAPQCGASLIGDTVTVRQAFDTGSGLMTIGTPTDIIVAEGPSDETMVGGTAAFPRLFDADAEEFTLFQTSTGYAAFPFNGYVIESLDWLPVNGRIIGVTIENNIIGFTDDRVTFDDNSVSINFENLSVNNGFVRVSLEVVHIPEPSAFALGGLGLFSLLGHCRRKRT